MKRLLQINVTANWDSTGRIAEGIGEAAMAAGWESYIAYGRYMLPSRSHLIKIGGRADQAWHLLQTRLFDRHGLESVQATKRFIKQIEQVNPDIIHLHNIHGYYLNYPILFDYLKRWGGPVVWTLHDCWPFTGHCAYYSFAQCDRWKSGCHDCPQRHSYPLSYADRSRQNYEAKRKAFTGLSNMTLIPVSDWLKGEVEKSFLGCYNIKRIYNGVDLTAFHPANKKFSILGVASVWNERKGLSDFMKLRELLPMQEVNITLIGLSDEQIASLPPGITGIKRTSSIEELVRLYSENDVYVNTSNEETLGMTTIEAQLCGTPVIVYSTTAIPESVASPQAGRIVGRGNVEAVAKAIDDLRNGSWKPDIEEMRRVAKEKFGKQKRYEEYVNEFTRLTTVNHMDAYGIYQGNSAVKVMELTK